MPNPTKIPRDPKTVGQRIRVIRGDMSQSAFATHLNTMKVPKRLPESKIAQAMISRYEKEIEIPSPYVLVRIARAGDTTIEWILTGLKGVRGEKDKEKK